MDTARLVALLDGWDAGEGPLYRRLADAVEHLVRRGDLLPGSRLPAERRLATELSVSRGTVVAAYARLRERDLIRSRQGSGTTVAGSSPVAHGARHLSVESLLGLQAVRTSGADAGVDLTAAVWGDAEDLPPDVFDARDPRFAELAGTHGYHPAGIPPLRQAVAAYLSARDLQTSPEQVLITSGAHQAIALLTRMCLEPGDGAVTEEVTYPGAVDALRAVAARISTVRLGPGGPRLDHLERLLDEERPRLLYLVPTVQNPTGTVMPPGKRRELVELLGTRDVVVVDDESLAESLLDGKAPPPVAAYARTPEAASRIFTVGSASKMFWGGLRVGWIRGPEPAIAMLTRLKTLADLASAVPTQVACLRLLERRDEVLTARRQALRVRMDALSGALRERLPEWGFAEPSGGLALWVRLPGADAVQFAEAAARFGVAVIAGPTCSPAGAFQDRLRLSLGPRPEALLEAARRLEAAWRSLPKEDQPASTLEVVV